MQLYYTCAQIPINTVKYAHRFAPMKAKVTVSSLAPALSLPATHPPHSQTGSSSQLLLLHEVQNSDLTPFSPLPSPDWSLAPDPVRRETCSGPNPLPTACLCQ